MKFLKKVLTDAEMVAQDDDVVYYSEESGKISIKEAVEPSIPNNEIWYTSRDGNVVTPYNTNIFGANIVSNTYENGKGIIKFDNDINIIGNQAFYNCSNLASITIPNCVTTIGESAYENCNGLTTVVVPKSITLIQRYAYYGCSNVTKLEYYAPMSLTQTVTSNMILLETLVIGTEVTGIAIGALQNKNKLTSIYCDSVNEPFTVGTSGEFNLQCGSSKTCTLHVKSGGSAATYPTWMGEYQLGSSYNGTWTVVDDL